MPNVTAKYWASTGVGYMTGQMLLVCNPAAASFQHKKIGLSETDLFGQNHFRKLYLPSRPSK